MQSRNNKYNSFILDFVFMNRSKIYRLRSQKSLNIEHQIQNGCKVRKIMNNFIGSDWNICRFHFKSCSPTLERIISFVSYHPQLEYWIRLWSVKKAMKLAKISSSLPGRRFEEQLFYFLMISFNFNINFLFAPKMVEYKKHHIK